MRNGARNRVGRVPRVMLSVWMVGAMAGAAHGQNVLGDGRVLDANQRVGTGGLNNVIGPGGGRVLDNNLRWGSGGWNDPGRDFRAESAYRNAIVTGNVAAGREFRGSVGYTAADDFRGFLGSNEIYRFERDSFYSGLATRNLGGIESIRNPLAYTVAGQRESIFSGGLIVNRPTVATTAGDVSQTQSGTPQMVDVFGTINRSLRSPSFQVTETQRAPELLSYTQQPNDRGVFEVMSASPLIGIRSLPSDSPLFNPRQTQITRPAVPGTGIPGVTAPGAEREAEPVARPAHQVVLDTLRGEAVSSRVEAMRATDALSRPVDTEARPTRLDDRAVEGEEEEGAEEPTGLQGTNLKLPAFDANLERLREALLESNVRTVGGEDAAEGEGGGKEDGAEEDGEPERRRTAPELAADVLAGKSALVREFAVTPTDDQVFVEHMRAGQRLMEEDRWFDAEERFTAALSVRPGDPMAAAGRVHAQVAGGMYRSAAVNLRNLYRAYPEMMVTRLGEDLLGPAARMDKVKIQLRSRMDLDRPSARDAALLLGYVGYQTDDRAAIVQAFRRAEELDRALGMTRDPLEPTLRAVWLGEQATAAPRPLEEGSAP